MQWKAGENCIMRSFLIYPFLAQCYNDGNRVYEISSMKRARKAASTADKRNAYRVLVDHLEDKNIGRRIILNEF
jgi:hypothetical protein